MKTIKAQRLKRGDFIGIIAPAASASLVKKENLELAQKNLESLGLEIVYGKNIFKSGSSYAEDIKLRLEDFHRMFRDQKIKAVMAVIGGFASNQLLPFIDYEMIRKHPKIFLGYSDITALQNAIFRKTGLITFSGPCFATFAQKYPPFDFELKYFKRILIDGESDIIFKASDVWAEDEWWKAPYNKIRELKKNKGWKIINNGKAKGQIIGGNLSTFLLLLKTQYCPNFKNKILFIEEDPCMNKGMIVRMITQLFQLQDFKQIRALVVGRFGSASNFTDEGKFFKALNSNINIPIVSNLDFGHTNPIITFSIGGECEIDTNKKLIKLIGSPVR
jgi:muramoyltetrapeptide carboxypeptidase LdcA involved in peptidoglycan recycling